jgi:hypothetical protein
MAHVEVSKLSGTELAELACTYAALLLHDDQQDITGNLTFTQEIRSANSSLPLGSKSSPTGLSSSLKHSRARTSTPSLTTGDQPRRLQLPVSLPKLLQQLKRKLRRKEAKSSRRRRKPLLLPLRKKMSIWVTFLADCLSDEYAKALIIVSISS